MKKKKTYPNDFRTVFGVGSMGLISVAGSALMTTMFMVYMTDYAGLGAWGATLATILLLVGRIVDAVNDPLQGWIMDRAKPTKYGKYKRFCIYGTIITGVSLILLYNLPSAFASKPVLVTLWTLLFYLAFDFGTSFYAFIPLIQSLSNNEATRAKLVGWNRIIGTMIAIPMGFFMTSALAINQSVGNIHDSIGIATLIWIVPIVLISFVGLLGVKEGNLHTSDAKDHAVKIGFKDILSMFKQNKPMKIHAFSTLFAGFMWTLMFATNSYYMKWAYCADLVTGEVDLAKLGGLTAIAGMLQIFPILISAALAAPIAKKLGSSIASMKLSLWVTMVPGLILYILQLAGILQNNIGIFLAISGIQVFGVGLGFVPGNTLWMECMDYNVYKSGHQMGGLVNAARSFIEKFQSAIATVVVGTILVAIGYNVDSVSGTYLGDLNAMPSLLNNFILVSGLIPTLLGVVSLLIYKKYPITPELRAKMRAKIEENMDSVNV